MTLSGGVKLKPSSSLMVNGMTSVFKSLSGALTNEEVVRSAATWLPKGSSIIYETDCRQAKLGVDRPVARKTKTCFRKPW